MSTNFSFGGLNVSFGGSSPDQVVVPVPTQPSSKLREILVQGQVPPSPEIYNQSLQGVPTDYVIDRKGVFVGKMVSAACIFFFVPILFFLVPMAMFDAFSDPTSESGIDTAAVVFVVIFIVFFFAGAISLIVSAIKRPRKIVFSAEQGAVLQEYGCSAPQVTDLDDLNAPYIEVCNDHKNKRKLHFDLRIPRLAGGSDLAIELSTIEARFKDATSASIQDEKDTLELIDIAANVCHMFRYVKQCQEPASIPLRLQFDLSDLD